MLLHDLGIPKKGINQQCNGADVHEIVIAPEAEEDGQDKQEAPFFSRHPLQAKQQKRQHNERRCVSRVVRHPDQHVPAKDIDQASGQDILPGWKDTCLFLVRMYERRRGIRIRGERKSCKIETQQQDHCVDLLRERCRNQRRQKIKRMKPDNRSDVISDSNGKIELSEMKIAMQKA